MARGWESKAVEEQVAAAVAQPAPENRRPSREDLDKARARESVMLSRKRVAEDIRQCKNPRYQKVLEDALKHLDAKLAEID